MIPTPTWEEIGFAPIEASEEQSRLASLHALQLLDSSHEERFDRITRLAAQVFGVPMAYVALIDQDRQWLKSSIGICDFKASRSESFCQFTIRRDEPLIVPDTLEHPLLRTHPLVTARPFVRFYGGIPLRSSTGSKVGTFCLADVKPHLFDEEKLAQLLMFAALAERELNLGCLIRTQTELLETRDQLSAAQEKLQKELRDGAAYVRRMLPPPLREGPERLDWQFHPSALLGGDGLGYRRIDDDRLAFYMIDITGHGLGSALLAVSVLGFLRSRENHLVDFGQPAAVVARLNRTFQMRDHSGKFFSVWYGVYSRSRREIIYANAGHPPPLLVRADATAATLEKTAPGDSVLGVLPELAPRLQRIDFPPGAELILFTDGLYELPDAVGGHGSYDEFVRFLQEQARTHGTPPGLAVEQWLNRAREAESMDDDVTLIRFTAPE